MNWGESIAMGIDQGTIGMSRPINLIDSTTINETDLRESTMFSILSINVRSMNNKFQKIRDFTHRPAPSVLCLQETWGRNPLTDYSIRGYHAPYIRTRSVYCEFVALLLCSHLHSCKDICLLILLCRAVVCPPGTL